MNVITVKRASGLLEPFDPPELTVEAAAERSWHLADSGLMLPDLPEYLPTRPIVGGGPWGFYEAPIPWDNRAAYDIMKRLP